MTSKCHKWESHQKLTQYALDTGIHLWRYGNMQILELNHIEVSNFQSLRMKGLDLVIIYLIF